MRYKIIAIIKIFLILEEHTHTMKLVLTKTLVITFLLTSMQSCSAWSSNKLKEEIVWQNPDTMKTLETSFTKRDSSDSKKLQLGIEQLNSIDPLIKNKNLAVFINHTSQLEGKMLHEILLQKGYYVNKIFTPEHGLKASADAGAKVNSKVDEATGVPIKSLYGSSKKPVSADFKNVDVVIFDMQDVGCRFYTYISSLQYMMEACAQYGKQLIILDRPNPNGHYVDGPVLDKEYKSFVGMQPVPIVHGMTLAEYALMLVGENWIQGAKDLDMKVVPCLNYTHQTRYSVPIYPSPNLRTDRAIQFYPALCLFEGTDVSVGRGTDTPFEVFGSPTIKGLQFSYSFIPESGFGASKPKHEGKVCNGLNVRKELFRVPVLTEIPIGYILDAYHNYRSQGMQSRFFNSFFNKLAGNSTLKSQIIAGKTEAQIRASWQSDLDKFKAIRAHYLLYTDRNVRAK